MPALGGGKDELNFISALGESPESGPSKEDAISHTLPAKYHGTRADQQDMIVLGKKQVLRVRAILRRVSRTALTTAAAEFQIHHYAGFRVDCHL